jgi:uncharacterized protein
VTKLVLAEGLSLPPDIATQVVLIAGKRGSGKTNTAKRLVEQIHRAKVPFGVLDPVDVWWGLKAGRDGTRQGGLEEIYVFGGKHADYPLYPTGGHLMADLFVDHRISAVMEMREWSGADRARFVRDFAQRLLERNTEPFVLVAEEAHDLMPQSPMGEEKGSLGAMLRLVKLGRSGGIGLVELTQRLAALNKTATTQADVLVMHRTTGPQDRKALNDWIAEHHRDEDERDSFLKALPTLKTGEAFVWAPDFPEDKPIGLQRRRILECDTFNSHATPKVGEKRVEPKELTKVDLARLAKAMAATVEKAKAEDPAELRKVVATLRAELKGAQKAAPMPAIVTEIVEKAVLKDGQLDRAERMIDALAKVQDKVGALLSELVDVTTVIATAIHETKSAPSAVRATSGDVTRTAVRAGSTGHGRGEAPVSTSPSDGDRARRGPATTAPNPARTTDGISRSQQRILDVLAWLEMVNVTPAAKAQVAGLAGQSPTSGGYFNNLGKLRSAGLIDYVNTMVVLTEAGRSAAQQPDQPPTNDQLHDEVVAKVSGSQGRILRELISVYPGDLSKDELAQRVGQSQTSGGYFNNLGRLRGLGFIEYPAQGRARAADILFLEAVR